ncbi:MAG: DUF4281 domain-containing protein [Bacteroidetes bacterium]|nr:DUF4281 domain-containing protein [Bacteroidota bacterium]
MVLAFFPKSSFAKNYLYNFRVLVVLAIFYAVFILWGMLENFGGSGGMDSLEHLRIAFLNDKVLTAAWLHYLVFDLFVGIWITKESLKYELAAWIKLPFLFFTLMFGPIGFLGFYFYREFKLLKKG